MEIHVFQNGNSSQTNAYSHYSNYSYSGLIPNEHASSLLLVAMKQCMQIVGMQAVQKRLLLLLSMKSDLLFLSTTKLFFFISAILFILKI